MRKFILFSSRSQMPYLIPGNFYNKKWSPKPDVKVPLGKKHVSLLDNAPNHLVGCVIQKRYIVKKKNSQYRMNNNFTYFFYIAFHQLVCKSWWSIAVLKNRIRKLSRIWRDTYPTFLWFIWRIKRASITRTKLAPNFQLFMTSILITFIGKRQTLQMEHFTYMGLT